LQQYKHYALQQQWTAPKPAWLFLSPMYLNALMNMNFLIAEPGSRTRHDYLKKAAMAKNC
jgi:hypothetical protein